MTDIESPITQLDMDKAWDLLASQRLGRVAVQSDLGVDIFPVNYAVDGESLVFRTAQGTKLSGLKSYSQVTFEIDSWDEQTGYSVVAKGHATTLTDPAEITQAQALNLRPWVPTVKTFFVRIQVTSISARKFAFGLEPPQPGHGISAGS
ncbi:MAG: pyridoxamine 5'-phosphate oxidase family protein [Propionibacteriaceae bacterium]|nr:pyridoxamine 5'-phosphate oxidase family protein [Propionibacteriaceae bacterium]